MDLLKTIYFKYKNHPTDYIHSIFFPETAKPIKIPFKYYLPTFACKSEKEINMEITTSYIKLAINMEKDYLDNNHMMMYRLVNGSIQITSKDNGIIYGCVSNKREENLPKHWCSKLVRLNEGMRIIYYPSNRDKLDFRNIDQDYDNDSIFNFQIEVSKPSLVNIKIVRTFEFVPKKDYIKYYYESDNEFTDDESDEDDKVKDNNDKDKIDQKNPNQPGDSNDKLLVDLIKLMTMLAGSYGITRTVDYVMNNRQDIPNQNRQILENEEGFYIENDEASGDLLNQLNESIRQVEEEEKKIEENQIIESSPITEEERKQIVNQYYEGLERQRKEAQEIEIRIREREQIENQKRKEEKKNKLREEIRIKNLNEERKEQGLKSFNDLLEDEPINVEINARGPRLFESTPSQTEQQIIESQKNKDYGFSDDIFNRYNSLQSDITSNVNIFGRPRETEYQVWNNELFFGNRERQPNQPQNAQDLTYEGIRRNFNNFDSYNITFDLLSQERPTPTELQTRMVENFFINNQYVERDDSLRQIQSQQTLLYEFTKESPHVGYSIVQDDKETKAFDLVSKFKFEEVNSEDEKETEIKREPIKSKEEYSKIPENFKEINLEINIPKKEEEEKKKDVELPIFDTGDDKIYEDPDVILDPEEKFIEDNPDNPIIFYDPTNENDDNKRFITTYKIVGNSPLAKFLGPMDKMYTRVRREDQKNLQRFWKDPASYGKYVIPKFKNNDIEEWLLGQEITNYLSNLPPLDEAELTSGNIRKLGSFLFAFKKWLGDKQFSKFNARFPREIEIIRMIVLPYIARIQYIIANVTKTNEWTDIRKTLQGDKLDDIMDENEYKDQRGFSTGFFDYISDKKVKTKIENRLKMASYIMSLPLFAGTGGKLGFMLMEPMFYELGDSALKKAIKNWGRLNKHNKSKIGIDEIGFSMDPKYWNQFNGE
jgi:hypothetical protein